MIRINNEAVNTVILENQNDVIQERDFQISEEDKLESDEAEIEKNVQDKTENFMSVKRRTKSDTSESQFTRRRSI